MTKKIKILSLLIFFTFLLAGNCFAIELIPEGGIDGIFLNSLSYENGVLTSRIEFKSTENNGSVSDIRFALYQVGRTGREAGYIASLIPDPTYYFFFDALCDVSHQEYFAPGGYNVCKIAKDEGEVALTWGKMQPSGQSMVLNNDTGLTKTEIDGYLGTDYFENNGTIYGVHIIAHPITYSIFPTMSEPPYPTFPITGQINGLCGPADGQNYYEIPTEGLCSAGSPSSPSLVGDLYVWKCFGENGGTTDYCSAYFLWEEEEEGPLLEATYPPTGQETIISGDLIFNAEGTITRPENDWRPWKRLVIDFYNLNTTKTTTILEIFPTALDEGESYEYDIAVELEDGAYKVSYSLISLYIPSWGEEFYNFSIPETIIRNEEITGTFNPPEQYEEPYLEDCEEYEIPNKWWCEMKNALIGAFVPSSDKIIQLKTTLEAIKNRFPNNYISLINQRVNQIQNNISTGADIEFSVLGQEGTLSNQILESAGLSVFIKKVFSFIFALIFLAWALSFIKRIF